MNRFLLSRRNRTLLNGASVALFLATAAAVGGSDMARWGFFCLGLLAGVSVCVVLLDCLWWLAERSQRTSDATETQS